MKFKITRANENKFDSSNQMWDRMTTLFLCGHKIDKIEAMVLGGTWGSYPIDYRDDFIRDMYYAANTFYVDSDKRRPRKTLEDEIEINVTSPVKIIGLTLETRPDHVTKNEILLLRKYNCTRVQIGVQHTDRVILSKINRGCYIEDVKRAIKFRHLEPRATDPLPCRFVLRYQTETTLGAMICALPHCMAWFRKLPRL